MTNRVDKHKGVYKSLPIEICIISTLEILTEIDIRLI